VCSTLFIVNWVVGLFTTVFEMPLKSKNFVFSYTGTALSVSGFVGITYT
jgi:hypothetical protein